MPPSEKRTTRDRFVGTGGNRGGSVPRTAAERCSQSVHGPQIDGCHNTTRNPAKQIFPKGEQPAADQNPKTPSAAGQSEQRRGNNRHITPNHQDLQKMPDKVHAEGEEERQPRIEKRRGRGPERGNGHKQKLLGRNAGERAAGDSGDIGKQAGRPARKTVQEPPPMVVQPGRQKENLFGLMQHEHRRKQP